jgi:hypothetical protein
VFDMADLAVEIVHGEGPDVRACPDCGAWMHRACARLHVCPVRVGRDRAKLAAWTEAARA